MNAIKKKREIVWRDWLPHLCVNRPLASNHSQFQEQCQIFALAHKNKNLTLRCFRLTLEHNNGGATTSAVVPVLSYMYIDYLGTFGIGEAIQYKFINIPNMGFQS